MSCAPLGASPGRTHRRNVHVLSPPHPPGVTSPVHGRIPHLHTTHIFTHHIHHTSLSPSHPPGVASPSHGRPTSHHLSPCTPPHTCYTLPRDEMRALMKVASFIIATLFISPYPTNPVITTSPWDIRVRFRPPPLTMDSYNVACSLGCSGLRVAAGCPVLAPIDARLRILSPLRCSPLLPWRTAPTDGWARPSERGATELRRPAPRKLRRDRTVTGP